MTPRLFDFVWIDFCIVPPKFSVVCQFERAEYGCGENRSSSGGGGDVAGFDHGLECAAFMFHVALGGFHEIGDEIIATL